MDAKTGRFEVSLVKCDLCNYKWVAVRDEGLERLECPNCSNIAMFENLLTDETV